MHYSYKYVHTKIITEKDEKIAINWDAAAKMIDSGTKMQDQVEYVSLLEDMKILDKWCQKKEEEEYTAFFQFFQDAIFAALYRYVSTKNKAWGEKRNRRMLLCTALIPVLSGGAMQWLSGSLSQRFAAEAAVGGETGMLTGALWGGIMVMSWLVAHVYKESNDKRQYNETWVRHSTCYARLHLALSKFVTSEREDEDYDRLVADVFAILEQNLDQFAMNLSKNGLAPRIAADAGEG